MVANAVDDVVKSKLPIVEASNDASIDVKPIIETFVEVKPSGVSKICD